MSMVQDSGARYCGNCGTPAKTRFCTACGAEIGHEGATRTNEGWSAVANDLVAVAPPKSIPGIALSFAKAPVATAMRLSEDAGYSGHWTFLLACLAAHFSVVNLVLPRGLAFATGTTAATGVTKWDLVIQQIVIIGAIAVMAPVLYYVCRWFSGNQRSPRAYMKLAALSFGYWYLLVTAVLLAMTALAALLFAGFKPGADAVAYSRMKLGLQIATIAAFQASVLWVVAAMNKRFWGLTWLSATMIGLGYIVVSQAAVFRSLWHFTEVLDLSGWLKALFG